VKLRCCLLSLLRTHPTDCQYCAREEYGMEMRKRLEELNWRTQPPNFAINRDREAAAQTFDSEQDEVVSSTPAA
jgi:hypothetical protein